MSVRVRLLLVSLATLGVGLGALLLIGNVLFTRTVDADTSQLLRSRAEAQVASLSITAAGVRVRNAPNDDALDSDAWILSGHSLIEQPLDVPAGLDRFAIALGRRSLARQVGGPANMRLLVQPLTIPGSGRSVGAVVVGIDPSSFDQLKRKVLVGSLAFALLVLAGGGLAIWRAVTGALDPVRRMTEDAENWGTHDLDRRFALGQGDDELTGLARTLDHLLERIASSRRHEQRFAGDVAHELRTPMAAIRGRAELALAARGLAESPEQGDALASILVQAERMSTTVETLITVARTELDPELGRVDLAAVAAGFDGVEVRALTPLPTAEGDPEIVQAALAPLVDNARRHARSHVLIEVVVSGDRAYALVRDDGPGIDGDLGERAFEPGTRGSNAIPGGAGLGLPLARRLAHACGGDVQIGSGPGGCFVLDLPASSDPPPT